MTRALAIALLAPGIAAAQAPNCGPTDHIAEWLVNEYGEAPQARGSEIDGDTMVIWANPVTGSWTASVTDGDGMTCIIDVGGAYQVAVMPGEPA